MANWRQQGLDIEWIDVVVTDVDGQSAPKPSSAQVWRDKHKFTHVNVVADASGSLLPPGTTSYGTPSFVLVDPRTQQVIMWSQGGVGPEGDIHKVAEALAKKNAAAQ